MVYTDSFRSYNALDVSEFLHMRIDHSKEFANNHVHINGIEKLAPPALRALEPIETLAPALQRNPPKAFYFVLERGRVSV